MQKTFSVVVLFLMLSGIIFSQSGKTVEILYFKANLACCKAKACNALEGEVKGIIEKNYPEGNVQFKEIKLADEANKALVEKYSAQSQTVVIVIKKKKKEKSTDISDVVANYAKTSDKENFETELKAKIDSCIKQKL